MLRPLVLGAIAASLSASALAQGPPPPPPPPAGGLLQYADHRAFALSEVTTIDSGLEQSKTASDRINYLGERNEPRQASTYRRVDLVGFCEASALGSCLINGSLTANSGNTAHVHAHGAAVTDGPNTTTNQFKGAGKGHLTVTEAVAHVELMVLRDSQDDDGDGLLNKTADGLVEVFIERANPMHQNWLQSIEISPAVLKWDGGLEKTKDATKTLTFNPTVYPGDTITLISNAETESDDAIETDAFTIGEATVTLVTTDEDDEPGGDGPPNP